MKQINESNLECEPKIVNVYKEYDDFGNYSETYDISCESCDSKDCEYYHLFNGENNNAQPIFS